MHDLPYHTLTQFAGLGLTLLAGWFLGLATAPGGGKWRDRFHEEESEHVRYRDETSEEIRTKTKRIRDLEADVARLGRGAPVAAAAEPGAGWRGWFGWGRDNLVRIRGIDEAREKRLNELGIKTYREIEKMTAEDEAALEQRLGVSGGTIGAEGWREQAALLGAGNEGEHARRFG
jgi:predicted flap endonuclease-1-like 5' DNA nuclease